MRLLDDERGQSVQVGAAILLGFVVIAITMYQVEVVADQNAEIEFNHQQEVRQDMIDVRNSISNAGTTGESEATSVKLGVRYPPRTIFINPAPARGILGLERAGNVSLSNAEVDGGPYAGDGNPSTLVSSNHSTNRLIYQPQYSEFGGVGNLTVEHSLAFASFENGVSDPMTSQPVVNGDTLTLTMLRGNLSEQGVDSLSVDPRTLSRTSDPITISRDDPTNPIVLTLPTRTPAVWNETIGTNYTSGEPQARVDDWDPAAGEIQVSLNRSEYDLQMAAVGVGTGVQETDRYDVRRAGGGSGGGGAYTLSWTAPDEENPQDAFGNCDADSCTWDVGASPDDELTLNATLDPPFEDVDLEFAGTDDSVANLSSTNGTTGTNGADTLNITARANGTVTILTSANDGSDAIELSVTNVSDDDSTGSDAIQFNTFQGFEADITNDEFTLDQISVQDADNDDDLDRVEYVVTNSSGTQVGSATVNNIGPAQYQAQSPAITIAASGDVQRGESYTIEATVYDADGNWNSRTLTDSVPAAASVVSYNNDGSVYNGQNSAVQFSVRNTGSAPVQVTDITVSSSSPNAQVLKEQNGGSGAGQREIHVGSPTDSGYYEAGDGGNDVYTLGTSVSFSSLVSIANGDDGTVTLYRFHEGGSGQSGNPVDMRGETVDVTLEFSDGSTTTFQVNVPN